VSRTVGILLVASLLFSQGDRTLGEAVVVRPGPAQDHFASLEQERSSLAHVWGQYLWLYRAVWQWLACWPAWER
jgi:hypothetical protein